MLPSASFGTVQNIPAKAIKRNQTVEVLLVSGLGPKVSTEVDHSRQLAFL